MISCIVTTYKRPVNILKRAVDSVINQTCQDTEIIVVNDAPQDRELAESIRVLLGKYSREIIYVVSEQSGGACSARNLGLEKATGEFVAFLDDDDEWLEDKIELPKQPKRRNKMNTDKIYAESIAKEYAPKDSSKIVALRKLDRKAKMPATIFTYTFGIISSLVLGTGMCFAMQVIGGGMIGMVIGILVGVIGIVGCGVNYPIYKKMLENGKKKYAYEIMELAREISENK